MGSYFGSCPVWAQENKTNIEAVAIANCKADLMAIVQRDKPVRDMWSVECTIKQGDKVLLHKMYPPVLTLDDATKQIKQFMKKDQYKR